MHIKRISAVLLSLVMLVSCFNGAVTALAAVTVEDGIVAVEEKDTRLNRYIFYPEELRSSSGKYPVIVWANGTGCQPSLYDKLLRGFAKQGYIVIASDETMAADGTDQSASLDFVIKKSKSKGNDLYNKVDTLKITAMGHSQGGRSAVNVAAADNRFACVVSIAGSNYTYEAERLYAPTLFLTGTSDSMVDSAKWVKPAYDACHGAAAYASLIGARHTACCNEPDKYIAYCVSWIKAWTENDNAALLVFKSGGALSKDELWTDVVNKNLTNNIAGTVVLSKSEYTYDGKTKKPTVTVKDYRGVKISKENYKVAYSKGCKGVGKYKVTVSYCGNLSGKATAYFVINPKGTSIGKITKGSKGVTVKWKKQTKEVSGYELQYSTSGKFKDAKKAVIKSSSASSKTIKGLTGKKYYFRIRTYKKVGKATYYSSWSKAASVKLKK